MRKDLLRILIVDDDKISRRILHQACERTGLVKTIDVCGDAIKAFSLLDTKEYDIVILDEVLPKVNGLLSIGVLKSISPTIKIIMVSSSDDKNLPNNAISFGATAFIPKVYTEDAVKSVNLMSNNLLKYFSLFVKRNDKVSAHIPKVNDFLDTDLILIASSTGGPKTLDILFQHFPKSFNVPIVIVQHMPKGFTHFFTGSINRKYEFKVLEVEEKTRLENGVVYIAKGGTHTVLKRPSGIVNIIDVDDSLPRNGVKPSADVTFESVQKAFPDKKILVFVLTGIGKDGFEGIKTLKQNKNVTVFTESEPSCVVYGMSKVIEQNHLSDYSITKDEIATFIGGVLG